MKIFSKYQVLFFVFACSLSSGAVCMELADQVFEDSDEQAFVVRYSQELVERRAVSCAKELVERIDYHGNLPRDDRSGGSEIAELIYKAYKRFNNDKFAEILIGSLVPGDSPIVVAAKLKDAPMMILLLKTAEACLSADYYKKFIDDITTLFVDGSKELIDPLNKLYLFQMVREYLPREKAMQIIFNKSPLNGKTSLMAVVLSKDLKLVKRLIKGIEKVITIEDKEQMAQFLTATIDLYGRKLNCFDLAAGNQAIQDYLRTIAQKYLSGEQFADFVGQPIFTQNGYGQAKWVKSVNVESANVEFFIE